MLVRPLSRTDEVIEDEHVSHVQSLQFLLTGDPYGRSETCAFSIHHHYTRFYIEETYELHCHEEATSS